MSGSPSCYRHNGGSEMVVTCLPCGFFPKRPGFENLSLIGSRTVETTMLFLDIESGPGQNGCRDLAALNIYRQRLATLP
ncbi:hypothetical protein EVAR_28498_1 [Eumeta japonica]|uniref:Uncharacterized protein n=1 Tax=Eumeta variegata TaxID=151549 RepID=A0A4C1WNU3_EUMVA|nr:hypothetical protein EVAR_28498_1 [Eumeta japonica]